MPRLIALIPAHNEQDGIEHTVASLKDQTVAVDRVIVMADNCTDATVERARAAGAEVLETIANSAKKAGALNQGLRAHLPDLQDSDFVICMDADGYLATDFVENALHLFSSRSDLGGLSGAIVARETSNFVETAQAIEYARGTRQMARTRGKVHVLSGACTIFPVHTLRRIAAARGTDLPGEPGTWFMEDSLTEDYELTLAIKKLGYACTSTSRCKVVTDVMPTFSMLSTQRMRWYRGALESLWLYGWSKLTHRMWFGVGFTFFASVLFPAAVIVLVASYLAWGSTPSWYLAFLFPLFLMESVVVARRVGRRASFIAYSFVPLWIYDNVLFVLYWRAPVKAGRSEKRVWLT
ncbi:MAG TPA: glycosyltransferase family 2 protein [Dermatophilaceae bacterium]|nr:glycosyltransferase family 2 protein [Dermatophilaceae bacterium]